MITRQDIESVIARAAEYTHFTADYERADRLWPAHYSIFSTNPLSIAYGACGTAEFLRRAEGELPQRVVSWLSDRQVSVEDYAPGLFVGMAGIAYQFFQFGLEERAEEIMATCYTSPLLFEDPTMFFGVAGWGLVSLYLHERTGRTHYLDRAAQACDHLMATALEEDGRPYWLHRVDDQIHYGYGYGASGIATFLLHAGLVLGRDDALALARRAVEFDLANHHENSRGWTWPDRRDGSLSLPYFGHGAAGVGTAAVRLGAWLPSDEFAAAACVIADSAFCKWTILPSQVEGVSGIAEFMLDMYLLTGRQEYYDRAVSIGETVLWYAIDRPEGIAFPGRWLTRVSTDYATGSAGIGLFLLRLLEPGPRYLVDLLATPAAGSTIRIDEATAFAPALLA